MTLLAATLALLWSLFIVAILTVGLCGVGRLQAWIWRGRLPGRLGALPVEEVEADEAPRGWKCAQLLVSPEGTQVRLAGVAVGGVYGAEDDAVCVRGHNHLPPALECACGFYAFARQSDAADMLARRAGLFGHVIVRALCEVDLSGTVIVCERGYRAERQRVLGIGLLPWCADCAAEGALVRAELVGAEEGPLENAVLAQHNATRSSVHHAHPSVRLRWQWAPLRPLCPRCARFVGDSGNVLTLLETAGQLGTEVRWLEPKLVSGDRVLAAHRRPWF